MEKLFYKLIISSSIIVVIVVSVLYGISISNALPDSNNISTITNENKSNNNTVVIEDVTTEPQKVKVGNDFNISVIVVNHTPSKYYFLNSTCLKGKPLSINFSKINIEKVPITPDSCSPVAITFPDFNPGQKIFLKSVAYKASSIGTGTATITFHYLLSHNSTSNINTSKTFSISTYRQ